MSNRALLLLALAVGTVLVEKYVIERPLRRSDLAGRMGCSRLTKIQRRGLCGSIWSPTRSSGKRETMR
jgi:hypothetical protein